MPPAASAGKAATTAAAAYDPMPWVKNALKTRLPAYLKARPRGAPPPHGRPRTRGGRGLFRARPVHAVQALPVPSTLAGFAKLNRQQWIQLAPVLTTLFFFVYLLFAALFPPAPPKKDKKAGCAAGAPRVAAPASGVARAGECGAACAPRRTCAALARARRDKAARAPAPADASTTR